MRRALSATGVLLLAFGAGAVVALTLASGPPTGVARAGSPPLLKVETRLPAWVAPGGRFAVSGFTAARAVVALRLNGRRVALAQSGRLGRFRFTLKGPAAGRYVVSLRSSATLLTIGVLQVRPIVLAAVGDVTAGEQVGPTVRSAGAAYPWTNVGVALRSADITTANLEGAISERGTRAPNKEFHFEGPAALLTGARKYGGMDVLTLANNHVMDYGAEGLSDTLAAARRAGIETVGAGMTLASARRPALVDVGGLTVAFLGYSDVNPLGFVATNSTPGTSRADVERIAADVAAARRRADLVVVWFHWGTELRPLPDSRQQLVGAAALNAGARVILGAHPHVLGPVQRPTRSSLVAWTLGNFVFPPSSPATARTAILLVKLGRGGVSGFRLVPATSGVRPALSR
jgi:poly-gamma-glutamate synthesis protein (capsule biosynthesis protein)